MDFNERRYNISLIIMSLIRLFCVYLFTVLEIKCINSYNTHDNVTTNVIIKTTIVFIGFIIWGITGYLRGYIDSFIEKYTYYEEDEEDNEDD